MDFMNQVNRIGKKGLIFVIRQPKKEKKLEAHYSAYKKWRHIIQISNKDQYTDKIDLLYDVIFFMGTIKSFKSNDIKRF